MARYALIRDADGLVVNVVEYGGTGYTAPSGFSVRLATAATEIGGTWNGSVFLPAPPPPPPTAEETLFTQSVSQLRATFNTARTAAQINNSIDALTVILRRVYRELL